MKLIFVGLGKMGGQIVAKLLQAGHEIVALDPNPEAMAIAVEQGAVAATSRDDALQKLANEQPMVWLMIPSDIVDQEATAWLADLPAGSTLVDGGNSNFKQTIARAKIGLERGIDFVDAGTSGGIMGLENGFSIMVGASEAAFSRIEPLIKVLSEPHGGYIFAGPPGAGHYVKMIHNGIEYGMMQAYAEGFRLLKDGTDFRGLDLAAIAEVWQHGSIIQSKLNELTVGILAADPEMPGIDGFVAATGEGAWAYETAAAQGIPMPALGAALEVRKESQMGTVSYATKLLAAMRNAFGGHAINK